MTTTSTQKQLIDFLWEWAAEDWQKILVNEIVSNEIELTDEIRKTIFQHYLKRIGFSVTIEPISISKPVYSPSSNEITLKNLSSITGVNNLAENQTINFSKNITVIYGNNGTGKTGYSRVLKSLGFSYDPLSTIHPNIYGSAVPKTATIGYLENGIDKSFSWNGQNINSDLQGISIFNNNCVNISLSDGRDLIVKPKGFHLFNLITTELNKLSELLEKTISDKKKEITFIEHLSVNTPQYIFISNLSAQSTEEQLNTISNFSSANQESLDKLNEEYKQLDKTIIDNKIREFNNQVGDLNSLISNISSAQSYLSEAIWEEIIKINSNIEVLESKEKRGIGDIAVSNGIELYDSKEFLNFLKSADEYIKILNKQDYPNEKDSVCVYCRQELSDQKAKDLISSYNAVLNDTTQAQLSALKKRKLEIIDKVKSVVTDLMLHQPSFGYTESQEILQPEELSKYNTSISAYKNSIIDNKIDNTLKFDIEYPHYITFFTEKKNSVEKNRDEKTALLNNLSASEKELVTKINELKDHKLLSEKKEEIKAVILSKKVVGKLQDNRNSFSTNSISRKTTEAREELVKQNFTDKFNEELKIFRRNRHNISLSFGTAKGTSKVQQKIGNYNLHDILSEGEQKAIALAEFLTELQLDNSKSPVIFDDPVNSLDHNILEDVAKRLIMLSKEKQVVIFTHSVLLFNSIIHLLEQISEVECKLYDIKNEYDKSGVLAETEEKKNSPKMYISRINTLLNNTSNNRPETEVAFECYGHLRSAIELTVEHEIFNGTVKRYQKNIVLTKFKDVKGDLLNQHKEALNGMYEKCCTYITGHSNAEEIDTDPSIKEFKSYYEDFKNIRSAFIN